MWTSAISQGAEAIGTVKLASTTCVLFENASSTWVGLVSIMSSEASAAMNAESGHDLLGGSPDFAEIGVISIGIGARVYSVRHRKEAGSAHSSPCG